MFAMCPGRIDSSCLDVQAGTVALLFLTTVSESNSSWSPQRTHVSSAPLSVSPSAPVGHRPPPKIPIAERPQSILAHKIERRRSPLQNVVTLIQSSRELLVNSIIFLILPSPRAFFSRIAKRRVPPFFPPHDCSLFSRTSSGLLDGKLPHYWATLLSFAHFFLVGADTLDPPGILEEVCLIGTGIVPAKLLSQNFPFLNLSPLSRNLDVGAFNSFPYPLTSRSTFFSRRPSTKHLIGVVVHASFPHVEE